MLFPASLLATTKPSRCVVSASWKRRSPSDSTLSHQSSSGSTVSLPTCERIRQFVAMPLVSGYSVEAQVTGQDQVGGLQFHVTPSTPPPTSSPSLVHAMHYVPDVSLKAPNPPGFDDRPIRIWIQTMTGKIFTSNALPFDWIYEVKLQVQDKEGIAPDQQGLRYGINQVGDGDHKSSDS